MPLTREGPMQIRLFIGPVSSGKTTRLIERYEYFTENDWDVLAVTHANESKRNPHYYRDGKIGSKAARTIPGKYCSQPQMISGGVLPADMVFIDEVQFFQADELIAEIDRLRHLGVFEVDLFGLLSDFRRQPWPTIAAVMPFCNEIVILSARCSECESEAMFSARIDANLDLVDTESRYEPRCHDHWRAPGEAL
jgi:thymidine kinase